jgi:hypothetical protein
MEQVERLMEIEARINHDPSFISRPKKERLIAEVNARAERGEQLPDPDEWDGTDDALGRLVRKPASKGPRSGVPRRTRAGNPMPLYDAYGRPIRPSGGAGAVKRRSSAR